MGYSLQSCKELDTTEATEPSGTHVQLNHFAVRLKLTPHCKSTVLQYKKNLKTHKVMTCRAGKRGFWEQ